MVSSTEAVSPPKTASVMIAASVWSLLIPAIEEAKAHLLGGDSDKAAEKILKAVRKDRMRVVIGLDALFFEGAKRAMPEEIHKMFLLMPQ